MATDRKNGNSYTCTDYRAEMILLGLALRLKDEGLDNRQKEELQREIKTIEAEMGMD
jgi:hypothetical protein